MRTTDAAHEAVVRELLERAWSCRRPADAGGDDSNSSSSVAAAVAGSNGGGNNGDSGDGNDDGQAVVYRAAYTGYYCVGCEEYKDESEMVAIPEGEHAAAGATCCPVHRAPCVQRNEVRGGERAARARSTLTQARREKPALAAPPLLPETQNTAHRIERTRSLPAPSSPHQQTKPTKNQQ